MDKKTLNTLLPDGLWESSLMALALTHRSVDQKANNERLEYLGDAALDLAVSQWLYDRRDHWSEGDMSRIRSTLVNRQALYTIGQHVGLNAHIKLSNSASGESHISPRVVAGTVEAVIGCVYLQCDWITTRAFILRWLSPLLDQVPDDPQQAKDNKTALQEWLQARGYPTPTYQALIDPGEHRNARGFLVQCHAAGFRGVGSAPSKKQAELEAAGELLEHLRSSKS